MMELRVDHDEQRHEADQRTIVNPPAPETAQFSESATPPATPPTRQKEHSRESASACGQLPVTPRAGLECPRGDPEFKSNCGCAADAARVR